MDEVWTSPLNLTIQKSHQTSISSTCTSDKKVPNASSLVEEILNSVVTYKNSGNTATCRRKRLQLPSVMTSKKWLDLKRATDQEKKAAESKKEERRKVGKTF